MSIIKNKDFGTSGNSVWHQPYFDHLKENFFPKLDPADMQPGIKKFLDAYPKWIATSKLNKFTGWEDFPYRYISDGTTQSLDWFHYWVMSQGRTLRTFRGEYPYHRDALLDGQWTQDRYIEDSPLRPGDAVLISVPFSASGELHPQFNWLMEECNKHDIPVLVDCAWFGTCYDIEVNVNYDCVKMVTFSTTKGLSCGNWRSGITFSKIDEGGLQVQTEWGHGVLLSMSIACSLFEAFTPDTIPKRYKEMQHIVCEHYGLKPTRTIHIASTELTDEIKNTSFNRDGLYGRVNIKEALKRYRKTKEFYEIN
tara:strand:- start:3353 stop:4279 length:927 start_codon:yes stop_codon:yes gene_type:complete